MNDPGGPPHNVEQAAPFYGPMEQDPPSDVPSFVCIRVPCPSQVVTYADRLDGCSAGIHATPEDINDPQVLHGRMADVIMATDEPPENQDTDDLCSICHAAKVPSPTSPVLYQENCFHYFHFDCFARWRRQTGAHMFTIQSCSYCQVASCRTLLWPQVFRTAAEKNELFQLQKHSFGLDIAPQIILKVFVDEHSMTVTLDNKFFRLCKRPLTPRPTTQQVLQQINQRRAERGPVPDPPKKEVHLVDVIQRLHLADQPRAFYLGNILPFEENAQYEANFGPVPPLDEYSRGAKLLLQFRCPHEPLRNGRCRWGKSCNYFHSWPENTPAFIIERVKLRQLPSFFCLNYVSRLTIVSHYMCDERIRMHSQELVRCQDGFHVSTQDLTDMDGFARKMATQILSPVTVPEPDLHLVCAFCRQADQPNSVWMHMENCVHCLHVRCLPLVRHNYSHLNRKLDVHCPACAFCANHRLAWTFPIRNNQESNF